MRISQLAIQRPMATLMCFFAILVLGLFALSKLPIDLLPEVEPPVISIIVPYPGASASDVESDVIKYLEDQLSTVAGIDDITALAKDNIGLVSCKFKWGTNLDEATNDIRDKLDLARFDIKETAPDSQEPVIFKFSSAMAPIMVIGITAPSSWPQLYEIVDKEVSDRLKSVAGVGAVVAYGGLQRQINIDLDWQKLAGYGISPLLVSKRLAEENIDLPAGQIKQGRRAYFVRLKGRYESVDDIKNILITQKDGRPVYLKDIAQIEDGFKEQKMKGYVNGQQGIALVVQKQSGANTVEVIRAIKKELKKIEQDLPADAEISILMDASEIIMMSIKNLYSTILVAGVFIVIITFLFLNNVRNALIISLSIPFSLIGAFLVMFLGGYTINAMSLMSLAIAIGMVVDNAIVVIENISRFKDEGLSTAEAAEKGTSEVAAAIFASSLTTIAVFVPLIFVTGLAGIMFKQLGSVVSATTLVSLILALTLTPTLAAHFWEERESCKAQDKKLPCRIERALDAIEARYERLIGKLLKKRGVFLLLLSIVFIASIIVGSLNIGQDFFPDVDTGEIQVQYELNQSERIEMTEEKAKKIMSIVKKDVPELVNYYATMGETEEGIGLVFGQSESANTAEVGIKILKKTKRKRSANDVADQLRKDILKVPGIEKLQVSSTSTIKWMLLAGRSKIEVEVSGNDLEKLTEFAKKLEGRIYDIKGATDIKTSLKDPRIEIHIKLDREKAARLGVTHAMASAALRQYIYGNEAAKFRDNEDDFDIFLRLKEDQRYDIAQLAELPVPTIYNTYVPLKNVGEISFETGPVQIDRKNRQRIAVVGCNISNRAMSEVVDDIKAAIKELGVPEGLRVEFGGEYSEQQESFGDLNTLLVIGMLLVYMILVGQFESLKMPFIIFFSLPFAFVGVIWALLLTGTNFSMVAFMAVIMLVGVVVNNAIVLVDYTNQLRQSGLSVDEALRKAGRRRLRPIIMTSLTTIFGMLPLAFGLGEGAEIWQPFGITAIGGLLVSGSISLIVVPIIYSLIVKDRSVAV